VLFKKAVIQVKATQKVQKLQNFFCTLYFARVSRFFVPAAN